MLLGGESFARCKSREALVEYAARDEEEGVAGYEELPLGKGGEVYANGLPAT